MHHDYEHFPSDEPLASTSHLVSVAASAEHSDASQNTLPKKAPAKAHLPHSPDLIIKAWEQRNSKHVWTADETALLTALHLTNAKNAAMRFIELTAPVTRSKVTDKIKKMKAKGLLP
ncbi:hypothetical protein HDU89_006974 [Geranomyces variabilis]|nr:hypothetical protein HDU89_006974 [Geranomyces variabilis]